MAVTTVSKRLASSRRPSTGSVVVATTTPTYKNVVFQTGNAASTLTRVTTVADSSTVANTITRTPASTNTIGTAYTSPYQTAGYWGVYFSSSYLSVADVAGLRFGAANFTIEAWVYRTAAGAIHTIACKGAATPTGWVLQISAADKLVFIDTATSITGTTSIAANTWTYVAVVRAGTGSNQTTLYINGVSDGTGTSATTFSQTDAMRIGTDRSAANSFAGYISNLRLSNTNLTISNQTAPLSVIASTIFYSLAYNRFVDGSSLNSVITVVTGTPTVTPFYYPSTFTAPAASTGAVNLGGSDYLLATDNAALNMGASDFTMECWYYPTTAAASGAIFSKRATTATFGGIVVGLSAALTPQMLATVNGSSWGVNVSSTVLFVANTWNHVALSRSSSTWRLFINGNLGASATLAGTVPTNSAAFTIGATAADGGSPLPASYISNVRVVKGTAVYTGAFAPPTGFVQTSGSASAASYSSTTNVDITFAAANTSLLSNFADANFVSTSTGIQNNTFVDSSNYVWNLARAGTPTQGSFTPIWPAGYWSVNFPGVTYASFGDSASLRFGAANFTIEAWIFVKSSGALLPIASKGSSTGPTGWEFQVSVANKLVFIDTTTSITGATSLSLNTWTYVAVVRAGTGANQTTLYINGVADGTGTAVTTFNQIDDVRIAVDRAGSNFFIGTISNFRLSNTNLTISNQTAPLTVISSTILYTLAYNRLVDGSSLASAVTGYAGPPQIQPFSPFSAAVYNSVTYGASGYFNGSTDKLTTPTDAAFNLAGGSSWTIEGYFWFSTTINYCTLAMCNLSNTDGFGLSLNNLLNICYYINGVVQITSSASVIVNNWYHIAAVSNGTTTTLYINGVSAGTTTTLPTAKNYPVTIGGKNNSIEWFNGYASNVRVVKGVAVYTGNFTPPSLAPLTASGSTSAACYSSTTNVNTTFSAANTGLLVNFANAAIYDIAAQSNQVTIANTQVSTVQTITTSTSLRFTGTSDWITVNDRPQLQLGSGDFTIEGWVYLSVAGVAYGLVSKGTASTGWSVNITSGNFLQFSYTATALTGTTVLLASTWYYFAVVRSGTAVGNLKIYLNGTVEATSAGAVTDAFTQTSTMYLGADRVGTSPLNGYLNDVRISSAAQYTANFANRVPIGIPIIGTAAATTSGTTATVSYSPRSAGLSTGVITSYTAVSSPGGIASTVYQSGAGTITVTGLTVNTAYTFTVYATNLNGNTSSSLPSNSITTVSAPGAPAIGTATATGPTTATVTYSAPASAGTSAVTSYTAVSSPGGITATVTQSVSGTIPVTGLSPGTTYLFTVYATNSVGNSVASAVSNYITLSNIISIPDSPAIGTAVPTSPTTATVTYSAPVNYSSQAITSYTAVSSPGGIVSIVNQSVSGIMTFIGLIPGTAYTFTVYATNSLGNSSFSAASNSITMPLTVVVPALVTVEYLVVAGGGGGGQSQNGNNGAGGGGAGGLLTGTLDLTASTTYTVTVGAGGAAYTGGSNSVFSSFTAIGGGGGAGSAGPGPTSGGSGGGGTGGAGGAGTVGPPRQGYDGNSIGGGGAGGSGTSPNGGDGLPLSITGISTYYAGGGAGTNGSSGGLGGGGYPSVDYRLAGIGGTPNTGGGAGGGSLANAVIGGARGAGGTGGSGIVIIAYPATYGPLTSITSGLTSQSYDSASSWDNPASSTVPNGTIRSGYYVYKFTAGSGNISWSYTSSVSSAPTIGTATATGATTATVTFTAPASLSGTVTSYTAVSSPGGIASTLTQTGLRTITITGLVANTTYTFTVYATNSVGNSAVSSASNSITTSALLGLTVEYLVVAGGGGGGFGGGGGGGAGGYLTSTSLFVTTGTAYTVTVGAGGAKGADSIGGSRGSNSVFGIIAATGGGGGGTSSASIAVGTTGGSGGGGYAPNAVGLAGNTPATTPSQGNTGGNAAANGAGGGGGSSGVGANASGSNGGAGGIATTSSITGSVVYYAGGGGGGAYTSTGVVGLGGGTSTTANKGGASDGTKGGGAAAADASANTGGGAGGGGYSPSNLSGGVGGSGVVVVAYPSNYGTLSVDSGLVYTTDVATRTGYRIYRFTSGTGPVQWSNSNVTPGAPTIVTATATGTTTATVSFTAPSFTGNSAVTSYTAVSSPGGITGTISQAGSGTISVTGLTANTTYSFTVYATNLVGNGLSSAASNSITTTTVLAPPTIECLIVAGGGGGGAGNAAGGGGAGGMITMTATPPPSVEYLVVAGGGSGGGSVAGGGGAGGLLTGTLPIAVFAYTVTVGAGGTAPVQQTIGNNGSDSGFGPITSTGGGGGASYRAASYSYITTAASSGGSGGGGTSYSDQAVGSPITGASGTTGQGYAGGSATFRYPSGLQPGGGGGGGAGAQGGSYIWNTTGFVANYGGTGGAGLTSSITGISYYYAGGGGGASYIGGNGGLGGGGGSTGSNGIGSGGTGGTVSGGAGGTGGTKGGDGGTNTGGGGGGGWGGTGNGGGGGGSGVVIIAYPATYSPINSIGSGLTYTVDTTTRTGYRVYRFTAGTGIISWGTVTVGGTYHYLSLGGGGTGNAAYNRGSTGANSSFGAIGSGLLIAASGGGGGGAWSSASTTYPDNTGINPGLTGGSGGGSSSKSTTAVAAVASTLGQGNAGGAGASNNSTYDYAGGGGGAGGAGTIGAGGAGLTSTITGSSLTYASGGAGVNGTGATGSANTGNGGAGSSTNGGAGGSGVVVIAYPSTYATLASIGGGLVYTLDSVTRSGYNVYRFTGGVGLVSWADSVPAAPTIGIATVTGLTSVSVAYTAPAHNGSSAITSYTAVSSPGGITATVSQSQSGTIAITGLTPNTAYTFTVYATNSVGNGISSSASSSVTTPNFISATGGTITTSLVNAKTYNVHTFTSSTPTTFVVSQGAGAELEVIMWGAGGVGTNYSVGSAGAYAKSTIIAAIATYNVCAGGVAAYTPLTGSAQVGTAAATGLAPGGAGGWTGLGAAADKGTGGAGGGGSVFALNGTMLVVAGGGGGAGAGTATAGNGGYGGGGGQAGFTVSATGIGGLFGNQPSSAGQDGASKYIADYCGGGGGGGGYRGGEAGSYGVPGAGGGGGSSLGDTVIAASGTTPGNSSDPLRGSYGGSGTSGIGGVVIVRYPIN